MFVVASVLSLVGLACQGERANYARDAALGSGGGGGGGGGGSDGGGPIDGAGERPLGTTPNGSPCGAASDCGSGYCADKVCCDKACNGTCVTCAAGSTPGTCSFADPGTDPRAECPDQGVGQCGSTGVCDGAGACRIYAVGVVCDATTSCDNSGTAVIQNRQCNGTGACVAGPTQSCGAYRCSTGTCGTTCAADNQCAPSYFCSAEACVKTLNLAGNGDLETGTTTAWAPFAGGSLGLSSTASGGMAHGGQYSISVTGRTQYYQGPSYSMPTGLGQYVISAWGLQTQDPSISGVLQLTVVCATTTSYIAVQAPSTFGVPMSQNNWTMFSATVDTSTGVTMPPDCDPNATPPGVVKSSQVYLNHVMNPTPVALPDLYLDDLVVQIPDGHDLVGNPNFEAGVTDGWSVNGGASTLAVSATVAHGGTHSLSQTGRTTTSAGPRYTLPIGTARYNLSFWVRHSGTATHDLALQPAYTCIGATQVLPPPLAKATAVVGNSWTQLSGTLTLPPANATPGCKLAQATVFVTQEAGTCGTGAGQVECPDLFVDDVSITTAP